MSEESKIYDNLQKGIERITLNTQSIMQDLTEIKAKDDHRDYRIAELEKRVELNYKDIQILKDNYNVRVAMGKKIATTVVVLGVIFTGLSWYVEHQRDEARNLKEYALSIPSPQQEEKIKELQAKLKESTSSPVQ